MKENDKKLNDIFFQNYTEYEVFSTHRFNTHTYTYILISKCTNKTDDTFENNTNICGYYLVDTKNKSVYGIDLNIKNSDNILFNVKNKNENYEYEIVNKNNKILNNEVQKLVDQINSGEKYKNKMRTIFKNYINYIK